MENIHSGTNVRNAMSAILILFYCIRCFSQLKTQDEKKIFRWNYVA